MPTSHGADWPTVTGERFRERRERLNLTQQQVADEAGIKTYDTVAAIEQGKGSPKTRRAVDDVLTRYEEEQGMHAPPVSRAEPHMIEIEVTGDFGVRVVVKGPVEDEAEVVEAAMKLVRGMKRDA